MRGTITIIQPDGTISQKDIDSIPDVSEFQAAVGGYIETVPYFEKYNGKRCVAFCHEEGKLEGLPTNRHAMAAWEAALGRPIAEDYLVGPICIISGDEDFLSQL